VCNLARTVLLSQGKAGRRPAHEDLLARKARTIGMCSLNACNDGLMRRASLWSSVDGRAGSEKGLFDRCRQRLSSRLVCGKRKVVPAGERRTSARGVGRVSMTRVVAWRLTAHYPLRGIIKTLGVTRHGHLGQGPLTRDCCLADSAAFTSLMRHCVASRTLTNLEPLPTMMRLTALIGTRSGLFFFGWKRNLRRELWPI
jgi:hypothetical protein